ncbi:MAG TPA: hypothetical protein VL401_00035 [Alphaproteobacteria bacterium]|jgi:hypothetical protein|nr:hypothetical protein [Alphaproteobacteria bacterium]
MLAQVDIGHFFAGGGVGPSRFPFQNLESISSAVTLFLNISFVLAGLILLFFFILGGIGMISSAGKNDPKAAEQAKATITSAVIGFVVVFASYWIVKLIGSLVGFEII